MKRFLLAGAALLALTAAQPALAADAPVYKGPAPYAAAAPFSWNGCYIGGHLGGGWGKADVGPTTPGGFTANADTNGWFGGGQVGCNWQTSPNLVLGIEADISGSNIVGSGPIVGLPGDTLESKLNYFGTARGRIGYAMDRALLYATGGFAWGNNRANIVAGGVVLDTDTQTHFGWTAGAGLEWAFSTNWSAKLEYLYLGLGSKTYTAAAFGITSPIEVKVHTWKVGLNWRF